MPRAKQYIPRLYRVRPEQDKKVKKISSKKKVSESEVIRELISNA